MRERGGVADDAGDSTGRLTIGRYVMDVGAPEGTVVQRVRVRGAPPPELADALARSTSVAEAEEAIEDAGEVAGKIDHAATLFTKLARGEIDVAAIAGELDRLFTLLIRLDRSGRHKETLRLARVLARLLALAMRLGALVETLRVALHAARALGDSKAVAWALHELGTLALGADDAQAAERDLGEARRLRREQGDVDGLAATERNLSYVGRGGVLASRAMRVAGGGLVLAVVLALVVVAVAGDDGPSPTPTPTPTATATPRGDETAPAVTLAADELTNTRAPTLSGTAGTEDGDHPTVTVHIYEGAETGDEPLQTRTAERGEDGKYELAAAPLTSGTYTARAEQSDTAGNTGRSDAVTFIVDLDAPTVAFTAPSEGAVATGPSPVLSGTAGQADGDEPTVSLTVRSTAETVTAEGVEVSPDGTWSHTVTLQPVFDEETQDYEPVTATVEQRDVAGNTGRDTVTFTPSPRVE